MARKKKPQKKINKIQIDITHDGLATLPPALPALPPENTETLGILTAIQFVEGCERGELLEQLTDDPKLLGQLTELATAGFIFGKPLDGALAKFARDVGEARIDADLAAAAEKYDKSGDQVPLAVLYGALHRVGHRLQQPFLVEGIKRLLEFCLRQSGTRYMHRHGLALAVKRLEDTPLEVREKSKELLQILSEEERELFLSKNLKLPLTDNSLLWGIGSKIAFAANHPCAAEPATMCDGYKAGKGEWDILHQGGKSG